MSQLSSRSRSVRERPELMTEAAFREFVAHWPEVAYLKNERLEHVWGNAACLAGSGLSAAEFAGTVAADLFPPEVARKFEAADAEILAGAVRADVGDICVELDGDPRWIHDTKLLVVSASGERMVGGVGVDITERVRAERAAREHAAFERLIADVAAQLTHASADDVRATIEELLRSIGEFLEVERAFLFRFSDDWEISGPFALWAATGISRSALSGNLMDLSPWLCGQLDAGRAVDAGNGLENLPEEARSFRRALERAQVNSGVVVPVSVDKDCIGMLGVDTVVRPREYSDAIIDRLRMIADMIGSTLRRIEVTTDLRRSLEEIRHLKERLEEENRHLRDEIAVTRRPDGIVGESAGLQRVLEQVAQVAPTDATVLLTGETGSGKEVIAEAIHRQSGRCDRPMIKVNCAALPPTLIEGELFGREKGAFTGATTRQAGRFEVADGSTIFLDEIADLPLELQAKLLHVLQDGAFARLGSNKTIKVDMRVIAATNRDLAEAVRARRFREDLFYRLNVFPIEVPSLRQRREDIIPLTWAFVDEFSRAMGKKISRIPKATADAIVAYDWPGNVRELRNVVERAMILARGEDLLVALPDADGGTAEIDLSLDTAQRRHIIDVLERVGWRVGGAGGAAALLGLPRSTLRARMRKLRVAPQPREEIALADLPRST